jgi:hypothetical protein
MPSTAYSNSWDGINYSFHPWNIDGTITFDNKNGLLVGAIRDNESKRLSGYPNPPAKSAIEYFSDSDENVITLAENEALQYLLLDFEDSQQRKKGLFGKKKKEEIVIPVITTAFWCEGDGIYSVDDETAFLENGGEWIYRICAPHGVLLAFVVENYDLSDDEIKFAEELFALKTSEKFELKKEVFSNMTNEESEGYEDFLKALFDFGIEVV